MATIAPNPTITPGAPAPLQATNFPIPAKRTYPISLSPPSKYTMLRILSISIGLIVAYSVFRFGSIDGFMVPKLFQVEHMRVDNAVFSPTTAFIRMEENKDTVTSITIDNRDFVRTLPDNIGALYALKTLTIINQPLQSLPESIGSLHNLESLTVYNTPLNFLPATIGNLTHLKKLVVVGTHITSLPFSVSNLSNLTDVNISYDRLSTIPASVYKLPKLYTLDMTHNHLASLEPKFQGDVNSIFLGGNGISQNILDKIDHLALYDLYY